MRNKIDHINRKCSKLFLLIVLLWGRISYVSAQDDYSKFPYYETGVYEEFNNPGFYQTLKFPNAFEIPCDTGKIRFNVAFVKQVSNSNTKRRVTVYRGSCKYLVNRDGRNSDGLLIFSNNKTTLLNLHLLIKRVLGVEDTSVRLHGVGLMEDDDILICYDTRALTGTRTKLLVEAFTDEKGYSIYRYREYANQGDIQNTRYRGIVLDHLNAYRVKEVFPMPWL